MLQLFGRAEAAARVRQAMATRGRPNPVLVFEGPPDSGKTSLLGRWPHGKKIALIQVPAGKALPSFTTP